MENKIYITFDIEWAEDEILENCIDLCEESKIKATFFATHDTPLLERIRKNLDFELGIHPNFNPLLEQRENANAATAIIADLKMIVPEAKVIRSHSLVQSSRLLNQFREFGFTHDANVFIPFSSGIELKAWRIWNGLIRVPHCWEDDIYWQDAPSWSIDEVLSCNGLKVFNFHPISLFLNIENRERYELCKPHLNDPKYLKSLINHQRGARSFFRDLVDTLHGQSLTTGNISEIVIT